jgi:hypothetical protein
MLLRKARYLARDSAGRRSEARTATTMITTSSSMSVKARGRIFMSHLVNVCLQRESIAVAMGFPASAELDSGFFPGNRGVKFTRLRAGHALNSLRGEGRLPGVFLTTLLPIKDCRGG